MDFYEGDNIGGIAKLEIAYITDFASFNPAVFKAGKSWQNVPFIPEKATFKQNEEDTENGKLYTYAGNFFVNKLRNDIYTALNIYIGNFSVLRITDLNNEVYIIGSPAHPCSLAFEGNTGGNYTDTNGGSYEFGVSQPYRFFRL